MQRRVEVGVVPLSMEDYSVVLLQPGDRSARAAGELVLQQWTQRLSLDFEVQSSLKNSFISIPVLLNSESPILGLINPRRLQVALT